MALKKRSFLRVPFRRALRVNLFFFFLRFTFLNHHHRRAALCFLYFNSRRERNPFNSSKCVMTRIFAKSSFTALIAWINRCCPMASCEPNPSSITSICRRAPLRCASTSESASRMAKVDPEGPPRPSTSRNHAARPIAHLDFQRFAQLFALLVFIFGLGLEVQVHRVVAQPPQDLVGLHFDLRQGLFDQKRRHAILAEGAFQRLL